MGLLGLNILLSDSVVHIFYYLLFIINHHFLLSANYFHTLVSFL